MKMIDVNGKTFIKVSDSDAKQLKKIEEKTGVSAGQNMIKAQIYATYKDNPARFKKELSIEALKKWDKQFRKMEKMI